VYFCLLVLKEFEIVEGKHNKNKTKTKIQHLHCKVETSGPYIARMDDTIGPAHRPQGEDVPLKKKSGQFPYLIGLCSERRLHCSSAMERLSQTQPT
jgi:hypothetical protein